MTGAQVAQRVLASNGLAARDHGDGRRQRGVRIQPIGGSLTDNYDPRRQDAATCLRASTARRPSLRPVSRRTRPDMRSRTRRGYVLGPDPHGASCPAANFGSQAAWVLIFIGAAARRCIGTRSTRDLLGIAFYACAVLFQIVTLPVEFDASRRALAALSRPRARSRGEQLAGARQVLTAAALTYVAAALIAVLQLLYCSDSCAATRAGAARSTSARGRSAASRVARACRSRLLE